MTSFEVAMFDSCRDLVVAVEEPLAAEWFDVEWRTETAVIADLALLEVDRQARVLRDSLIRTRRRGRRDRVNPSCGRAEILEPRVGERSDEVPVAVTRRNPATV